MAVNATISSITLQSDGTGTGANYLVAVTFNDVTTGFNMVKNYSFAANSTVNADKAVIQADLNTLKTQVAAATALQSLVGTVLT